MHRFIHVLQIATIFIPLCFAGCGGPRTEVVDVPIPYADPKPKVPGDRPAPTKDSKDDNTLREGPFSRSFAGITFSVPRGWKEVKLAPTQIGFVDARFVIPTDAGVVELTCLSNRGGIDSNISRWIGQFQTDPGGQQTEKLKVDGAEAVWVDLKGTFNASSSGKPGPHPEWRMLGIGIPLKESDFYLKLNGPQAGVNAIAAEFREMVRSARISAE